MTHFSHILYLLWYWCEYHVKPLHLYFLIGILLVNNSHCNQHKVFTTSQIVPWGDIFFS